MQVEVADMKSYDGFYKRGERRTGPHRCHLELCHGKIKYTTALPVPE